jgi:hypothetical protein
VLDFFFFLILFMLTAIQVMVVICEFLCRKDEEY